jgi:hypothetical protein
VRAATAPRFLARGEARGREGEAQLRADGAGPSDEWGRGQSGRGETEGERGGSKGGLSGRGPAGGAEGEWTGSTRGAAFSRPARCGALQLPWGWQPSCHAWCQNPRPDLSPS